MLSATFCLFQHPQLHYSRTESRAWRAGDATGAGGTGPPTTADFVPVTRGGVPNPWPLCRRRAGRKGSEDPSPQPPPRHPPGHPLARSRIMRASLVLYFIITVTYYCGGNRRGLIPSLADREVFLRRDTAHTSSSSPPTSGPRWRREPANIRHRIETSSAPRSSCWPPRACGNDVIAARLDTPRQIVSKWRHRFFEERLAGLEEEPRGGRAARFSPQRRRRR